MKKAVNPFHIGAEFINYCVKNGWIVLDSDGEDKRLHYYVTDDGEVKLDELYGIKFDCPCALEPEGFLDSL